MKALLKLLLIVGVTASCLGSNVLSRLARGRSKRDLTGNECVGQPHGAHIPYPGDCTKYLVCEWNSGTVMNCPSGLHFNQATQGCDWPTSAGCTQGSTPTASPTAAPTTVPSTVPSTVSSTVPSTLPSTVPSTVPSTLPSTVPSTVPPSTTSSELSTLTVEPDDDVCVGKADGTLSPYPYDCAWYIRCENDQPLVLLCEEGKLFNDLLLICDLPENVDCTASPYPTKSTTVELPTTTPSTTPSTTPQPTTIPTTISSTVPTPPIISTLPSSTTPSESPTPTLEPEDNVCAGEADGTLSSYPYDCAWYIRCENNEPLVLPCENGWLFNDLLLICDYPENVDCTASPYPTKSTTTEPPSTTPPPTTVSTTISSTVPTPPIISTLPASTTPSESPTPTLEPEDNVCAGEVDGTLSPYPYDCAWYIRCENNEPLVLPCENGWLFNDLLLICDYPENVDCTASPYPTKSTTTELPTTTPLTTPPPTTVPTTISSTLPTPPIISTLPSTVPTTIASTPLTTSPSTAGTTPSESTPTPSPTTIVTATPTLPSADDDICLNEVNGAVLPYPWDCAWYVRCENQRPELLPCDDGYVYNSILRICDFPANVECVTTPYPTTTSPSTPSMNTTLDWSSTTNDLSTEPGSTRPPYVGTGVCANQELGTRLPYPKRCSLYIVCEETAPTAYSCDEGMEFNAALKICQEPEKAGCSIITTTSTTTEATSTPATEVPTGICAGLSIGDLVAYPGICSEFILCQLPIPVAQVCPDGLEFNADQQLCEAPVDAGCSTTTPATTTTPTATETTPAPAPQPGFTGICRGYEEGDLIPYPGDCNKYIICENPIPIAQKCGAGQDFNADLSVCDDPDGGGCSGGSNSTTEATPTTSPSPGGSDMVGICKGYQQGDLIPYPNNCNKYVRCELPVPIAQTCKEGLHFNEALGICDAAESAGCPGYTTTESPSGSTTPGPTTTPKPPAMTGICSGQEIGDKIPYPANCSKYIVCDVPVPIAIACQNGLHFNAELQVCDDPSAAGCELNPPVNGTSNVCCGQPIGTLVPYPDDCTQYIVCDYPIPKALPCCAGLHFNAATKQCDSVESAGCATKSPLTCATAPSGTALPIEGTCKSYYQCENGASIPLPCPGKTVFSANAGACISGTTCPT